MRARSSQGTADMSPLSLFQVLRLSADSSCDLAVFDPLGVRPTVLGGLYTTTAASFYVNIASGADLYYTGYFWELAYFQVMCVCPAFREHRSRNGQKQQSVGGATISCVHVVA